MAVLLLAIEGGRYPWSAWGGGVGGSHVGVLLIRTVLEGRSCDSPLEIFLQVGICGGRPMSLSAGSVGESGGSYLCWETHLQGLLAHLRTFLCSS
jgi:hypothetical protein